MSNVCRKYIYVWGPTGNIYSFGPHDVRRDYRHCFATSILESRALLEIKSVTKLVFITGITSNELKN